MPPVRRSGPAGPRPPRRPRVAGTRGLGPAATPGDGGLETDSDVETSPALEQEAVRPGAVVEPTPAPAAVELPPVGPEPAREALSPPAPVPAAAPALGRPAELGATPTIVIRKVPRTAPAVPAEVAGDDPGAEAPVPPTVSRRGLPVAAVLLTLAVLLGAVAVVASFKPGVTATTSGNTAFVDTAATSEVAAAAINAVQKTYSYSFTTIGSDLTAATDLMTPDMASKHQANIATIKDAVTQAKTTSKAQVTADGVRTLQGDRAEVVAFVVVTSDNGGTALAPVPLRFTAQMQRVDGTWKLSGLVPS